MEIIQIAAMAKNRVIGNSITNDIPWHIQGEQQRFKEITMGHTLVMGRKTYESIGHPLPGRDMIIVTRNKNYSVAGGMVVHSLDTAFESCQEVAKVFIVGGGNIYRQTIAKCSQIILTTLERSVEGDIFFPEIPVNHFKLTNQEVIHSPEKYTIDTYCRI